MESGDNKKRAQTSQLMSLTNAGRGGAGPKGGNLLSVMSQGSKSFRQKSSQSGRTSPVFSPSKRGSRQEEAKIFSFGNSASKNMLQLQLDPNSVASQDETSQLI